MAKTYDKKFKQEVTEYAFNHSALVARKLYSVPKTTLNAWLKKYKQSLLMKKDNKQEEGFSDCYIKLIDKKIMELQEAKDLIKKLNDEMKVNVK